MTPHAMSQDISGWSDKTVCRLVKSDSGAAYVEEASSRGLNCKVPATLNRQTLSSQKSTKALAQSNTVVSYGRVIPTFKRGEITIYKNMWNIPEYVSTTPNLATLRYYGSQVKLGERQPSKYTVYPSGKKKALTYNIKTSEFLKSEMLNSSILRYQLYNNGSIIHDEKSPPSRFGDLLKPGETYHSNSMGKSLVSYVVGHAVCEGYIRDINVKFNDWALVKDTAYENQKLIDLLNMTARDSHIVDSTIGLIKTGRWYNTTPFSEIASKELKGTKPRGKNIYHYNGLVTNILLNYTIAKTGNDFNLLLNRIFRDKAQIANQVYFNKIRNSNEEAWYQFHATPEDYMRIAISMMEDVQNDTCVGQYLTELQSIKVRKQMNKLANLPRFQKTTAYGGQFHLKYKGMADRNVFGLSGYGGQYILIDATNSRIAIVNTIHTDYDWDTLIYKAIKNGDIPN